MKHKAIKFFVICLSLLAAAPSFAQAPKTDEQKEKEFMEALEKQISQLEDNLKLEDWQVFYVDSILTHDYKAMREEMEGLNRAKVENADLYIHTQDKWMEKIYNAFHKVFNDEQWARYLKSGAGKEKKARDKREAKRIQ